MISYTGIEINGDYSKLMGNHPTTGERLISEKHIDNVVIETFNKYLGDLISKIIIEWPYYDQDYLSTYYLHYAKKFRNFPKYCYRLHFISQKQNPSPLYTSDLRFSHVISEIFRPESS